MVMLLRAHATSRAGELQIIADQIVTRMAQKLSASTTETP